MIPIALAATSAAAYGISDYLGGVASRRARALRVVCVSYPISILLVTLATLVAGGSFSGAGIGWGLTSGLAAGIAVWTFYAALARGPMSVISPLTAVLAAGVPVVFALATGERPTRLALAGMAVALVATCLVSLEGPDGSSVQHGRLDRATAVLVVLSGLSFAAFFILLDQVPAGEGLWPVVWSRVGATLVVFAAAMAARESLRPGGRLIAISGLIAVFDVIANSAFYLATQAGMLALVSVIATLYPVATVLLALTHGGERLRAVQVVGLVLAVAAIALIALA